MVTFHLLGMVRPALRGEGPELGREPRVEHVLVLMDVVSAALRADVDVIHRGVLPPAVLAVEHGDAVAPPELARDAPVLEVLHPGEVGARPAVGVEGDLAVPHDLGGTLLELVDGHEPLLGEPRLERRVAAVAVHDGVVDLLDVVEEPVALEPVDDCHARLIAAHARELAVAVDHVRRLVEDVDLLEAMRLAHGIVVGVVGGRDLDEARAEARIDVPVGEDGDLAVDDREHDRAANELDLLGVLRGDGDSGVAEHGLGARRGHGDVVDAVDGRGERVAEVPEVALLVVVLGLVVRDGGAAARAPVDDALAAVDETLVVPVTEDPADRPRELGAHRELLVIEVDRAAHALDLAHDGAAVLVRPVPAGVDEGVTAHLEAGLPLRLELLVDLRLSGDARVVGAENPAGRATAHAVVADEGVLDGVVHGMPHVQDAGHVRWRDDDCAVAHSLASLVASRAHPLVDELGLPLLGVIRLGHLFHGASPLVWRRTAAPSTQ